jgi:hypothetical protein
VHFSLGVMNPNVKAAFRLGLALALAAPISLLAACGGKSEQETGRIDAAIARGSNPPGLTMTVCGTVVAYVAPAAATSGSLELDRGKWELVPAAPVAFETLLTPGSNVCVHASLDTDKRVRGVYVYTPEAAEEAGEEDETTVVNSAEGPAAS